MSDMTSKTFPVDGGQQLEYMPPAHKPYRRGCSGAGESQGLYSGWISFIVYDIRINWRLVKGIILSAQFGDYFDAHVVTRRIAAHN